jgi:NAD(P)-dependent dehydrogenase (short-subunit alcohol dehydrogenase family)
VASSATGYPHRDGMSEPLKAELTANTPLGQLGQPRNTATLVAFLCSPEGGWINGQLIRSNGGLGSWPAHRANSGAATE